LSSFRSFPEHWGSGRDDVARRVVRVGAVLAVIAVLGQTAVHLTNRAWISSSSLDADVDGNVLTWISAEVVFTAALALALMGTLFRGHRLQTLLLAGVLAVFVVDDLVALHERVSLKFVALLGVNADLARLAWPMLYGPLLLFVLVALWQIGGRGSRSTVFSVRLGLVLLVAAVVIEALWAAWHVTAGRIGDWPDTVEVALEEGIELAAWTLIASGLVAFLATRLVTAFDRPSAPSLTVRSQPASAMPVHDASADAMDGLAKRSGQTMHEHAGSVL
jgi:uncharacterized protein YqgC (DUF456 family)